MRNLRISQIYLLLLATLFLVNGCSGLVQSKEKVIADMIQGGMSVRSSVMDSSDGTFSDYQVYRDGEKDGVVFEYVYSSDVVVDRSMLTPAVVKEKMISQFKQDKSVVHCLNQGIYLRIIFKAYDGEVYCDIPIDADDF